MQKMTVILDALCSILESFLVYLLIDAIFERRYINEFFSCHKGILKGLCAIFSAGIIVAANHIALVSPYTVLIWTTTVIMCSCLFWKCDFIEAVGIAGMYAFIVFAFSNVVIAIVNGIGGEPLLHKITSERGIYRISFLIIYHVVWCVLNLTLCVLVKRLQNFLTDAKRFWSIPIIGALGSAFFTVQLLEGFNMQMNLTWYIFLVLVMLLIYGVYLNQRNISYRFEMEAITAHNKLLENNYKQINDFYNENAKLYHDMNYHFKILYNLLENDKQGQAKEYLKKIITPIKESRVPVRSGIDMLDVVFFEMEKKAHEKNLRMEFKVQRLPTEMFLEKKDLCILFANLLDNAIEAARMQVTVEIKQVQKMLMIAIKNDYVNKPLLNAGRFVTTKADKSKHGFGMKIVDQIIEKYDGDIEYSLDEQFVYVEAMLNNM